VLLSQATPAPLLERYGHTTVLDETGGGALLLLHGCLLSADSGEVVGLILVFAGCSHKGQFLDDLWTYNIGPQAGFFSFRDLLFGLQS
jgi:hypothetical protein